MSNSSKAVEILVVDSSVLIKNAPLNNLTDRVYTIPGVVAEIKDENTRASLQVLPYDFKLKEPNSDALKFVTLFARKTGDLCNLSSVDLNLIALTYQLCKENLSAEEFNQLRTEPPKNIQPLINANELKLEKPVNVAGFYLPPKSIKPNVELKISNGNDKELDEQLSANLKDKLDLSSENNHVNNISDDGLENTEESEELEDGDVEEGWITPSNLNEIQKQCIAEAEKQEIADFKIKVGCMTSDFSMQNVLIQIGITVLSMDGLLIKKPRSYVLRCITCMKITTNMSKQFCPHCGYKTLERVVVTVDAEGNRIYRGRRKPLSTKGLRFSLPMPKGGKHSNYPILSEDQPRAHNFPSKRSQIKTDALDPDYVSQSSPFATKDVYSRSANLGIRSTSSRFNKRK